VNRAARVAVTAWCALQCVAVYAQEPGRAAARLLVGTPSRQLIDQKHAFVARLLGDSSETGRIAKSGNPEARESLQKANELHDRARAALEKGDLVAADAAFNEAIWMIGKARQLVPDTTYRTIEQRFRYEQLVATLDSLQRSYRQHLSRLGRAENDDPGWNAVSLLIERARSLYASGQLGEAALALLRAEQRLLEAFGGMLAGSTLDYTPRFGDQAEEFRFELERNRGYRELVPIALSEFNPSREVAQQVGRHLESDRSLSGRARELAEKHSYAEALSTIRASTVFLQRALRAAGLEVPEDDGGREPGGAGR
jgi:hypothetical protein